MSDDKEIARLQAEWLQLRDLLTDGRVGASQEWLDAAAHAVEQARLQYELATGASPDAGNSLAAEPRRSEAANG